MFRTIIYWGLFCWAAFISYHTVPSLLHGHLFTQLSQVLSPSNIYLDKPFSLAFQTTYFLIEPLLRLLAATLFSWRVFSIISTRNFTAQSMAGFSYVAARILLFLISVPVVFALVSYIIKSGAFWFGASLLLLPLLYIVAPTLATLSFVVCETNARLTARKTGIPNPTVKRDAP